MLNGGTGFSVDGDHLMLHTDIAKVDTERRTVSGFATLDNIDQHDDVILSEASKEAFANFRGNIREQHNPYAAVGKLLSFNEEEYFDTNSGEVHKGIYVTAYISRGAQDTWEKVLDGTLTGFSIGGKVMESESEFVKEAGQDGRTVRFIKKYALNELSLVDSPANQLANVFSFQKSEDGMIVKGIAADTSIVNVLWCGHDDLAKTSDQEVEKCFQCDSEMKNIGWVEKGNGQRERVGELISKFLSDDEAGEGGVNMPEEAVNTDTEQVEESAAAVEAGDEVGVEEEAPVESPEEVEPEGDLKKMLDEVRDSITEVVEKNSNHVQETLDTFEKRVEELNKKSEDLEKSLGEAVEKFESLREEREEFGKRLDSLEGLTAIKKSTDDEDEQPKSLKKGLWSGTILG